MLEGFFHWLQFGPTLRVWIFITAVFVVVVVCFYFAYQAFYRKRLIEDIPTSKIRSAAQGYVELEGNARLMDGPPIVAPLSGQHCVWYQYRIEERKSHGKNHNWVTVNSGISDDLFLLVDETGHCVVDPENAKVTPTVKQVWYGDAANPGTIFGGRLGSAPKLSRRRLFGRYRYTEKRIHIDEPLHAIGLFRSVGGAGEHLDINEDTKELLMEWKRDSNRILNQFDANEDGKIDMEEWQQVREAAYQEVLLRHRDEKITMPTHLLEQTHDRRRPYILSAKSQSDFVADIGNRLAIFSSITSLLAVILIYLVNLRLTA